MADLYTKGQIITPQLGSVKTFNYETANKLMSQGKQEQQAGEKRIEQVQDIYNKQLNITAQGSLSALANNPALSSNPQAMATEIDKVVGKMSSEIPDNETKVNFLMNMELKKQSYINNAQANFNKEQEERRKATYYNSIYDAMDGISLSLSNGLRGTGNVDDLINATQGQALIKQSLESVNNNGKPMFSITQQQQMRRDADRVILDGVKQTIDGMTEDEASNLYEKLKTNSFSVGQIDGKEVNLQDVLGDRTYADVKRYAMNRRLQDLSLIDKQAKIDGRNAIIRCEMDPTETNYNEAIRLNPNMSDKQREHLDEIFQASPNYEATTKYADLASAINDLNTIASKENEQERSEAYTKALLKATRSNVAGTLSMEDLAEFKEQMRDSMLDEETRKIRAYVSEKYKQNMLNVLTGIPFILNRIDRKKEYIELKGQKAYEIEQQIENTALQQRLEMLATDYSKEREKLIANKDLTPEERKQKINDLDTEMNKKSILMKNPDVDGKEIGDVINRNGILYTYEGMTNNDIVLKIVK